MAVDDETRRQAETAATSAEHVGIVAAVAVLLGGIAVGAAGAGTGVGSTVADHIQAAVVGTGEPRRWRDARERRWGGGTEPVRVSRDELRMSPGIDDRALWSRDWARELRVVGADVELGASACAACVSAEWSHELRPLTASVGSDGSHAGLAAGLDVGARVAAVAVEAHANVERDVPGGRVHGSGRVRAFVGAEADATARIHVGRDAVDAELEGGAMAGAVARAQGRVGVDLLGVAISQSGTVEGWAGAGIKGVAGVHHGDGRFAWRFGWGGAIGLGGAGEWSGQVDASRVPPRHRRLARDALLTGIRSGPFGAVVPPATFFDRP